MAVDESPTVTYAKNGDVKQVGLTRWLPLDSDEAREILRVMAKQSKVFRDQRDHTDVNSVRFLNKA